MKPTRTTIKLVFDDNDFSKECAENLIDTWLLEDGLGCILNKASINNKTYYDVDKDGERYVKHRELMCKAIVPEKPLHKK